MSRKRLALGASLLVCGFAAAVVAALATLDGPESLSPDDVAEERRAISGVTELDPMPEYAAAEAEPRALAAANQSAGPEPDGGLEPEPVWFEGIADGGTSFFPSSPFAVSTHWVDVRGERVLQAFAGTLKADRSRGLVLFRVVRRSAPRYENPEVHWAPPGVGPLTLTGGSDDLLAFRAENGITGTFDVVRREYRLDP